MKTAAIVIAGFLAAAGGAQARPVECDHPLTRGQHLVCGAKELRGIDKNVNGEYQRALMVAYPPDRFRLRRTQKLFLAARDGCRTVSCLSAVFQQRLYEIRDIEPRWGRWSEPMDRYNTRR